MAGKRTSMTAAKGQGEPTKASPASSDPFAPVPAQAVAGTLPEIRPGFKLAKAREVKPHVSLYLHPRVIAKFKEIAAVENCRPHDVYLRAIARYLEHEHGLSLEALSKD